MAGVSKGTTSLLAALSSRASTELGTTPNGVSMKPGDEIVIPPNTPMPREHQLHVGAAALRDPVANTEIGADGVFGAAREIALLAAHERAVQRGVMTRMRMIATYRNRLGSRINLLRYGIPEGLVPL